MKFIDELAMLSVSIFDFDGPVGPALFQFKFTGFEILAVIKIFF